MKDIISRITRPAATQVTFESGKRYEIVFEPVQVARPEKQTLKVPIISQSMQVGKSYEIKVKKYMTKKASADFDFMQKWNNDCPMPFVEMTGKVIKETRGMVYMQLHGLIRDSSVSCMRCGRALTNDVSKMFGLGPECGGHAYINPFDSKEDLHEYVRQAREKIVQMSWEGWVIRSAILEYVEV